jgi:hypothetical protein
VTQLRLCSLLLLLCTTHLSCNSLDIPPAPDVLPILEAYGDPDANVTGEIMENVAEAIADSRDGFEDSDIYEEVLEVITDVQAGLDETTDEQGDLTLDGIGTFPAPSGAVAVNFICTGWGEAETADSENGTLELTMTLFDGGIGPLVWGTATGCRYGTTIAGEPFELSYDGDVAIYFGEFFSTTESLRERLTTFIIRGTIGINGTDFPVDRAFRVDESGRLDILIQLADGTNFIYFFDGERFVEGIEDANGRFGCSLEDRQCITGSGTTFFW